MTMRSKGTKSPSEEEGEQQPLFNSDSDLYVDRYSKYRWLEGLFIGLAAILGSLDPRDEIGPLQLMTASIQYISSDNKSGQDPSMESFGRSKQSKKGESSKLSPSGQS